MYLIYKRQIECLRWHGHNTLVQILHVYVVISLHINYIVIYWNKTCLVFLPADVVKFIVLA